jgi:hypothetical protein
MVVIIIKYQYYYMSGLLLKSIIMVIFILGILVVSQDNDESFVGTSTYSNINEGVLLDNYYPLKNPGSVSNWKNSSRRKPFPTWDKGPYEQKTNNIKYPTHPCNSSPLKTDFCGELYDEKESVEEQVHPPPRRNCRRVNYYCAGDSS